jgi:hypothetical protein
MEPTTADATPALSINALRGLAKAAGLVLPNGTQIRYATKAQILDAISAAEAAALAPSAGPARRGKWTPGVGNPARVAAGLKGIATKRAAGRLSEIGLKAAATRRANIEAGTRTCSDACLAAMSDIEDCVCPCGGANHGLAFAGHADHDHEGESSEVA